MLETSPFMKKETRLALDDWYLEVLKMKANGLIGMYVFRRPDGQ
jgi:hypothetical protein